MEQSARNGSTVTATLPSYAIIEWSGRMGMGELIEEGREDEIDIWDSQKIRTVQEMPNT